MCYDESAEGGSDDECDGDVLADEFCSHLLALFVHLLLDVIDTL